MKNEELIKEVLTLELDVENAPTDFLNIYEDLIVSDDIDEELDKAHIMYSFYTVLGQEYEFKARELTAELERWEGKRFQELKSSHKKNYTDASAKRKMESSAYRMRTKVLIAKYEKLSKQLIFGGGRGIWMKGLNIKARLDDRNKLSGDLNLREDESLKPRIKSRLRRKNK